MSTPSPYRVAIWLARELTIDIEADSPDMAQKIATAVLTYGGESCFASTGCERMEFEIIDLEGQQ